MTRPILEKNDDPKKKGINSKLLKNPSRLPVNMDTPGPREKAVAIAVTTPSWNTKFFEKESYRIIKKIRGKGREDDRQTLRSFS